MRQRDFDRSRNFLIEEEEWMRRALIGFVLFGSVSNLGASIAFAVKGLTWLSLFESVFMFLGIALAVSVFHFKGDVTRFARLTAALFIVHVGGYFSLTGGIGAEEALLHFTVFPTLFVYFLGVRSGIRWSLAAIALVLLPIGAFWAFPNLPIAQHVNAHRELVVSSIFFIYLAQMGFNALFQKSRLRRIGELEELNSELAFRLEVQRRLEREREEMGRQVLHASKLAAIGELAAGVAHEINNPLMIAGESSELIRSRVEQTPVWNPELDHLAGNQRLALERIRRIVASLRNFSRSEDGKPEPFDAHQAIAESVALIEGIYSRQGVPILVRLEADSPVLHGNAGRFNQVIVNLIANAKDAVLASRSDGRNPRIEISTRADGRNLRIQVIDNGCGIPEANFKRIFEPFFTTKGAGKGTGLGLSLSSSIVSEMRGTLSVDSRTGHGSTFTISVPLGRSEPVSRGDEARDLSFRPAELGRSEALKGRRILVVEDEAMISEVLHIAVTARGAQCQVFGSAEEALENLAECEYDAVISDLNLPGASGNEFLGKVSLIAQGAPRLILITGSITADEQELADRGITLLLKPFDMDQIVDVLETALGVGSSSAL